MTTAAVIGIAVIGALVLDGTTGAQTRDIGPRPVGTAVLTGRVVRIETAVLPGGTVQSSWGRPVARAVVTLDPGDGRGLAQTATNDDGVFRFERLAAGRFLLTASKVGWVTSHYGSTRPGQPPGVRVAVADGARVEVEIPMAPGAVIAGRITDGEGRPMARQYPWLLQMRLVGDRMMLARVPFQLIGSFERSTDDRGEFRLFGLPPGTYYLVVNPTIPSGARVTTAAEVRWATQPAGAGQRPTAGPIAGYASTYYPGTIDPSQAQPILVRPGEVREGLDFRVTFAPVARIEGAVWRGDGSPAERASIELDARVPRVSLEGMSWRATTDAAGRFFFDNVPPGDYRISARASSAPPAPAKPAPVDPQARIAMAAAQQQRLFDLWGHADVVLTGQDTQSAAITLGPASSITGRLAFSSTSLAPPADLTTVRLQFIATAALAAAMTGAGSGSAAHNGTVDASGAFRVAGLPPDRYLVAATWPGMRTGDGTTGWWLTTIQVDGRDLGDRPIDVQPNENVANVTLGFRDRIGAIEGVLTDAQGRAAPGYYVLAFPVERESWRTTSRRNVPPVQTGTDGRYRLVGLLPGAYYLAVVTEVKPDEAMDPTLLDSIVTSAVPVKIGDGEMLRQDLKIGR
jgi:protocatechuate 3,4-dioxygenase beta subunit